MLISNKSPKSLAHMNLIETVDIGHLLWVTRIFSAAVVKVVFDDALKHQFTATNLNDVWNEFEAVSFVAARFENVGLTVMRNMVFKNCFNLKLSHLFKWCT